MDADGTNQTRITNNESNEWRAVWSPDGTRLVVTSDQDGNGLIYVMNIDGTGLTRLTDEPGINASWKPDGTAIIFNSNRSGNHEIYILEVSGNMVPGEITRLTQNGVDDGHPMWRPDNGE